MFREKPVKEKMESDGQPSEILYVTFLISFPNISTKISD